MSVVEKKCPYCKTIIEDDAQAVVCSACDMPHHKDCWVENQGCTTFGCVGTIQCVSQSPTGHLSYNTQTKICNKCFTFNELGSKYCFCCGTAFGSIEQAIQIPDFREVGKQAEVDCPKCKAKNEDTNKFCFACGTRLMNLNVFSPLDAIETHAFVKKCVTCGNNNYNKNKYCLYCGHSTE